MTEMIELDERLSMLAALTPACPVAADIGADHGFLGAWLLESGKCERVQFLDISEASLKKASRLIRARGLTDRAVFSVGDGAEALREPADAVVIAGMGATTIEGILERGRTMLGEATLILQPNINADHLRLRLMQLGYEICDEDLARAGGRWYVGMSARPGYAEYSPRELLAGPALLKKRHPMLSGYAQFRLKVQRKACEGAARSDEARAQALREEIECWEEIVAWLRQSDRSSIS
ncbi:MAG: SAM-dependent methyltransferase [Clostridia bacterium]|nr:SAM-dependent methyltransferase [Clostridia bacterium]